LKLDLERLVADGGEGAEEAAQLLLEWIRLEGRARRVLSAARAATSSGTDFSELTLHAAAQRVLEEEGRPLHARELGERIKARGWRHRRSPTPRPDQIVFQLAARLPKHGDVFRRVAPNTFALASWTKNGPPQRPKPRLGIFSSGGGVTGAIIGEQPEAPMEAGEARWRSS